MDDDYNEDGNNIVDCPLCLDMRCPGKDGGVCPKETDYYMNKKQRVKQVRDTANSLGLCRRCFVREVKSGHNKCENCVESQRKQSLKRRLRDGNCSRCGCKNERCITHKTCVKCSKH